MKITYWSDYACPYCYIGEARLKKALEQIPERSMPRAIPRLALLTNTASVWRPPGSKLKRSPGWDVMKV